MPNKLSIKTPDPRRPARRTSLLWYVTGAVLICLGSFIWLAPRNSYDSDITGRVLRELTPADRIVSEPGALKDWNVLLITMDTTRADHLGCYGNRGVETPVLDQLARDGVLFAKAITPVPATLPAHSSMMTGQYPFHHGARANGTFKLTEENETLAEILRSNGYRTGAAISAFVLDGQYGLDQGFETFADDLTNGIKHSPQMFRERPAELTNEPVFNWLEANHDEPFFFWVHYFDPHAVYLPPEPFRSRYAQNLYNGEIAYVDAQIGKLLDYLGPRRRLGAAWGADAFTTGLRQHAARAFDLLPGREQRGWLCR